MVMVATENPLLGRSKFFFSALRPGLGRSTRREQPKCWLLTRDFPAPVLSPALVEGSVLLFVTCGQYQLLFPAERLR